MAKKKAAPQHVEPEFESRGVPEEEPARVIEPARRAVSKASVKPEAASKSDAIRQALAAGFAGPQEGTAWIRDQFGIVIEPGHFSAVKATEKKKGGAPKGKPGRKPREAAKVGQVAAVPNPRAENGETDLLSAMEAMKPLVASLGKDQVKRIVDLLG